MEAVWFILLAWVLATYVVLDGFDFGVGILHLFVAKTDAERKQVLASIGPVWDGNEVWLLVAGGTMFFAFPKLLAVALSGFYLPIMIVLWLILFRALGIELRHQMHDSLWVQFWDACFFLASLLLAIFFGAALGNVVRGVPLTAEGTFFEPLWTNFLLGPETGILDWYTILVALTALSALSHHGALWLNAKTQGAVQQRAHRAAGYLFPWVLLTASLTTLASFWAAPNVATSFHEHPWGMIFSATALGSLLSTLIFRKKDRDMSAFIASAIYLYSMIALAAVGIYPYVLPARNPALGLRVDQAASQMFGLKVGLYWWVPGMLLAIGYFIFIYSRMPKRFSIKGED